ncbi:CDK5RAP3 isoform A [Chlorella sorokiniana]|uniref:CDK5RAP3 isoform A n=1 Tax=Chlorella sorokiniana TaxID=3076 RepID=A0A2P6TZM5_CHLSO|nr:CDK5RAP3 isoform A [Chlorella sorokiniana]|eukprot:PRW59500.1 CDK5RAP3 isoform A [Chlorella sorokiniana]
MAALTAKLVGGGYERPDADKELPLDVNYAKLPEWLVDRKQVPTDWSRKLQAIQAKAAEAVNELPPGFLGQFEGGEEGLDYFLAKQVLAKLSETAEKGLLGGLKGAAGSWDKVVKAYEYNLIYVAEAAQALCRNADYEIPFLKKQAAKCQQQLADLERKKADAQKSAAAAAADFQQECRQLGIDSSNIRTGLLGLTAELPALAGAAVEALQADGISQGIEYYAALVDSQQQGGEAGAAAAAADAVLPTLREVREGRTTPPAEPAAAVAAAEPGSAAGGGGALEVDWDLGAALEAVGGSEEGGSGAGGGAAAGISWDLDASDLTAAETAPGAAPGVISWDVEVETAAEAEGGSSEGGASSAPVEISWDIELSGVGEDTTASEVPGAGAAAAGGGTAGGSAAAAEAVAAAEAEEPAAVRRLVADAAYRAQLLDDLHELRAFLMQCCRELGGNGSKLLATSAPEAVRHVSADLAAAMLEAVNAALSQFGGEKLKQLIALRTSGRYLDRMAAGLQQQAGQEAKFLRAAADAELRRGEIQRQLMADSAKLAVLLKRSRQAKAETERALGAKLGRRVNIQGEINQLLAS